MEFEYDKVEYHLLDFFEKFSHDLPKVVVVAQGFCGEILADTFDKEQVIRLHTFSRQTRVAATKEGGKDCYSIPLEYPVKFQIVKHHKKTSHKDMSLKEIVTSHKLPVEVQFAHNQYVTVGSSTLSTSHFPRVQLTDTFDEIYFLGNFINDGAVDARVVPVPLYLSQMTISLISGIKGQPPQYYERYVQDMDDQVQAIHFDISYGNKDIAVYTPGTVHADTVYSSLEPKLYANLEDLFHTPKSVVPNVYEKIDEVSTPKKKPHKTDLTAELESRLHTGATHEAKDKPPPPGPKPKPFTPRNSDPDILGTKIVQKKEFEDTPPAVPKRNSVRLNAPVKPYEDLKLPKQSNDVYDEIEVGKQEHSNTLAKENPQSAKKSTSEKPVKTSLSADEIKELSISQLGHWMKRLRLDKHVKKFEDDMIDGHLLNELDTEMLIKDFQFTNIEAIRLMKFAKEGHIPK